MKKLGLAALVVCAFLVFRFINDSYCAGNPDTLMGVTVKWAFWDPRMC